MLVHGSDPLARQYLVGDTRRLVRLGFAAAPALLASRIPTLWLFGDRDESGPTFASVRMLDAIRATGEPAPLWDDMTNWLGQIRILDPSR